MGASRLPAASVARPGGDPRGQQGQRRRPAPAMKRAAPGRCLASVALRAMCCDRDTIPKPDGLAGRFPALSSNENRMQRARCPVLFERERFASGVGGTRGEERRCLRIGSICDTPSLEGYRQGTEVPCSEPVGSMQAASHRVPYKEPMFTHVITGRGYPAALLRKWSMVVRMASCLRRGRLSMRSRRSSSLRLGLRSGVMGTGLAVCSKS